MSALSSADVFWKFLAIYCKQYGPRPDYPKDPKLQLFKNALQYLQQTKDFVCLFDLILNVPSTIFQLHRDGSSWVEPVLS